MVTNKEKFNKKYGFKPNQSHSVAEIAKLTGIKKSILDEVGKRGAGAWKTNIASVRLKKDLSKNPDLKKYPRSTRLTKEQWAISRIYSFVMGGTTQKTADKDLWNKHLKNKNK